MPPLFLKSFVQAWDLCKPVARILKLSIIPCNAKYHLLGKLCHTLSMRINIDFSISLLTLLHFENLKGIRGNIKK